MSRFLQAITTQKKHSKAGQQYLNIICFCKQGHLKFTVLAVFVSGSVHAILSLSCSNNEQQREEKYFYEEIHTLHEALEPQATTQYCRDRRLWHWQPAGHSEPSSVHPSQAQGVLEIQANCLPEYSVLPAKRVLIKVSAQRKPPFPETSSPASMEHVLLQLVRKMLPSSKEVVLLGVFAIKYVNPLKICISTWSSL